MGQQDYQHEILKDLSQSPTRSTKNFSELKYCIGKYKKQGKVGLWPMFIVGDLLQILPHQSTMSTRCGKLRCFHHRITPFWWRGSGAAQQVLFYFENLINIKLEVYQVIISDLVKIFILSNGYYKAHNHDVEGDNILGWANGIWLKTSFSAPSWPAFFPIWF